MQFKGYFTNIFRESAFSLFFVNLYEDSLVTRVHDYGKFLKKDLKFDWGEAGFVCSDLLTE